jgi:hypothetical protein
MYETCAVSDSDGFFKMLPREILRDVVGKSKTKVYSYCTRDASQHACTGMVKRTFTAVKRLLVTVANPKPSSRSYVPKRY